MRLRTAAVPLSLLAAAAAAGATRIRAYDLWWHLETGEWIVKRLAVPRSDFFSFTSAGVAWVDHGWLWQVIAWSLHRLAGPPGLLLLKVSCGAVIALLGWAALRRASWGPHAASLAVILALAGIRFRLSDRPETAGLALAALFLFGLTAQGLRPRGRLLLSLLVPALWANVHASALLAPLLAAASAAGSLLAGWLGRARALPEASSHFRRARLDAGMAALAAAGLLLNPYGVGLLAVPLRLRGALSDPRLVNPEWLPPRLQTFPLFAGVLAAVLTLCALQVVRRANAQGWKVLLMAGLIGGLGLSSARHVGFLFAALPFLLAALGSPFRRGEGSDAAARRLLPGPVPAVWAPVWGAAAALLFVLVPNPHGALLGPGVQPGRFPAEETDYIERKIPPPRSLYNEVAHGGYLIWRFYPRDRVFIDGRNEVHRELLKRIAGALDDGRAWQALLEEYGIRAALVRYRPGRIPVEGASPEAARSFAALHFPRSLWALVHWGDTAMVFVRREEMFQDLIARDEYRFVDPEDWEYQLERCRAGDLGLLEGILQDLRRRQAEGGGAERVEALLSRFGRLLSG